jgi:hypothetical protein
MTAVDKLLVELFLLSRRRYSKHCVVLGSQGCQRSAGVSL